MSPPPLAHHHQSTGFFMLPHPTFWHFLLGSSRDGGGLFLTVTIRQKTVEDAFFAYSFSLFSLPLPCREAEYFGPFLCCWTFSFPDKDGSTVWGIGNTCESKCIIVRTGKGSFTLRDETMWYRWVGDFVLRGPNPFLQGYQIDMCPISHGWVT